MTQSPQEHTAPPRPDPVREAFNGVRTEIGKAVVGQDQAVTGMLIALLCRSHVLLQGVPGVSKTLLVLNFAAAFSLDSARVQFSASLVPSDVICFLIYAACVSDFSCRPGREFTTILIDAEIFRTP